MIPLTEYENNNIIITFYKLKEKYYKDVELEFHKINKLKNEKNNKDILQCLYNKHLHLKRFKKLTKYNISTAKAYIYELLDHKYFELFTLTEKNIIYNYHINKIRGLYKHAQALKTGFCNLQIINGFSEKNTITICLTKNTLEANEQWLKRLFKELNNRYPHEELKEQIMIISSQKNDLDGNATHCKNYNTAWRHLKKDNNYKIVFMCSNKTRISDILEISQDFNNLKDAFKKKLIVLHDEAHNAMEGIPPFRDIIENIISQSNILSYQPITASNGTVINENNQLWLENNIEHNSIDYIDFDDTKSTDSTYSSCSNAKKIYFDKLKTKSEWKDYSITYVSRELFIKVDTKYKHKQLSDITDTEFQDIDRRRKLEFCDFMKIDKEQEALNNGLNCINLNKIIGSDLYISNELHFYIISTPRRNIITRYLSQEAIKMEYNPIVLSIYGNQGHKYHLFYDKTEIEVSDIMSSGEFNEKLYNIIKHLKTKNININRPFIIIGNYTPTGESLSFVNYKYGTIRCNIRLISTNAEEDYQNACRSNYMTTKFIENNHNWKMPEKYLIGETQYIKNALSYELENDARIDYLKLNHDNGEHNNHNNHNNIILPNKPQLCSKKGIVAIPIKITLDRSEPKIIKLIAISLETRKTDNDKLRFINILKECCEDDEIDCRLEDISGKFNWNYKLNDFRCYIKKPDGPKKGQWKFKSYQNHFEVKTQFMNNRNNHKKNDCEILICNDKYLLKDTSNKIIEENSKCIWWIGYKY